MIANSLSHLLALLRKQIQLARQIKMSYYLLTFVLLSTPLLFFVFFNLVNELELSQAVTFLEATSVLKTLLKTMPSNFLDTPYKSLTWWQSFRTGFVRGFWGTVLALPISALVWCLVILLVGAFRKPLRNLPQGQIIRKALLKWEKAITLVSVFLLLVALMPTMILLLQDVSLSASEFVAKYIWELFVSVMLVALTVKVWKLLVGKESLDDTLVALEQEKTSGARVKEIERSLSLSSWKLLARKESLGDMLVALDQDEITQREAEKIQQFYSLEKWLRGDNTGWCELWDTARFAGGLHPAVYSAVKEKLQHLVQTYPAGSPRARYAEQFQLLLSNSQGNSNEN